MGFRGDPRLSADCSNFGAASEKVDLEVREIPKKTEALITFFASFVRFKSSTLLFVKPA